MNYIRVDPAPRLSLLQQLPTRHSRQPLPIEQVESLRNQKLTPCPGYLQLNGSRITRKHWEPATWPPGTYHGRTLTD